MDTVKLIAKIKTLVAENDLEQAINELKTFMENQKQYNSVIIQSARYNDIESQIRINVVSKENADIEKNKIRLAILQIVDNIKTHYNNIRKETQTNEANDFLSRHENDEMQSKFNRLKKLQQLINDYEDKLMIDDDPMRQMQYEKKIEMLTNQSKKIKQELQNG